MLTITEKYKEKMERIKQKLTEKANNPKLSDEQRKLNKMLLDEFICTDEEWQKLVEVRIELEKDCLKDIAREAQMEVEKSS